MLILQGMRQFVRQHHPVDSVLKRLAFEGVKATFILVVKSANLLTEQRKISALQIGAFRQKTQSGQRVSHVVDFPVRIHKLQFVHQCLPEVLPLDFVVADRGKKREPSDSSRFRFDPTTQFVPRRRGNGRLSLLQDGPEPRVFLLQQLDLLVVDPFVGKPDPRTDPQEDRGRNSNRREGQSAQEASDPGVGR